MYSVVVSVLICVLTGTHEAESSTEKHDPTFRIIDGQLTDIREIPHQVSIMYNGSHHCGGSIISQHHILTAAHCTYSIPDDLFEVRAGSNTLDKGGIVYKVEKIDTHPKFTLKYENDVAVIKLAEPLIFDTKVMPVTLPIKNERLPKSGTMAMVSGWGRTNATVNKMSPHLLSLELPLVSYELCKKLYKEPKYVIDDKMFCAGFLDGGADSCLGDSGGALLIDGKQFGIVSWGVKCGMKDKPGVYALVPRLRNYIFRVSGV